MLKTEAVIFDMDGVLVDSERLHVDAWLELFAEKDIHVSDQAFEDAVGQSDVSFLEELFAERGIDEDVMTWLTAKKVIFNRMLRERGTLFPGALELVRSLHGRFPLAVASSSWRESVGIAMDILGISEYLQGYVGKDDVTEHKPDPEVYLLAASRLGVGPERCVAIEDSRYGIDAALAAGMRCIAVAHSLPADQISRAHLVVEDLSDHAPILDFVDAKP